MTMKKLKRSADLSAEVRRNAATARMRAAGYYPVAEVAQKMQIHIGSVYRWISDGDIAYTKIAGRSYISYSAIVMKIGIDAARAFGFSPLPAKSAEPKKVVEQSIEVETENVD